MNANNLIVILNIISYVILSYVVPIGTVLLLFAFRPKLDISLIILGIIFILFDTCAYLYTNAQLNNDWLVLINYGSSAHTTMEHFRSIDLLIITIGIIWLVIGLVLFIDRHIDRPHDSAAYGSFRRKQVFICPNCGNEMHNDDTFCSNCGNRYSVKEQPNTHVTKCKNCGALIAGDTKFCPHCGNRQ